MTKKPDHQRKKLFISKVYPDDDFCPECGEQLPQQPDFDMSEGQYAEWSAGFRTCLCGWEGYIPIDVDDEVPQTKKRISKKQKRKSHKIGVEAENKFVKYCKEQKIIWARGKQFVISLLYPKRIRKISNRKRIRIIKNILKKNNLYKPLYKLFNKKYLFYIDMWSGEDRIKIRGIPDYIIILNQKPLWVEVKAGRSDLSSNQRTMKKKLEKMGFNIYIYRPAKNIGNFINDIKKFNIH